MLKAVFAYRGELNEDSPFSLANDGTKVVWPESEPVVFNFRLPHNHHRVALFEKIHYMNLD